MEADLEPCKGKGTMVVGYLLLNIGGGILMESEFKIFGLLTFFVGFLMFLGGNLQNWIVVSRYKKSLNNTCWKSSEQAGKQGCKLKQVS
jgi:hypothetical protein